MPIGRRQFTQTLAAAMYQTDRNFNVAVIGAGVFGAWTAHHLRKAGQHVVLLDAYGAANSRASSGGETRIIRMGYGADEIYTRSSQRSLVLWKELVQKTGQQIFHETGVLWMAAQGNAYAEDTRRTLQKCGVHFEALAESDLKARYPQIEFASGMWGILEPESGALMARRAVQTVVADAVRSGTAYLPEAVVSPEGKGQLASIRTTGGTTIRAGVFVFACGPWLPKVFPHLLGKRLEATRQEVFFFGVPAGDRRFAPPALPVWIDFSDPHGPYGFPDIENRGFKIALDEHGPHIDPDTVDRTTTPGALAAAREAVAKRFPALGHAPVVETRVCQYENSSNGDFLIDRHPDFSNVWLVGGGSGHGFKHGPAVGEYTAARILDGGPVDPRYSLGTKSETHKRTVY